MKIEKSGKLVLYEQICFAANNKSAGELLAMKNKTKQKLHLFLSESV